jgi:tetratricopeptide (TPR) repeat protein
MSNANESAPLAQGYTAEELEAALLGQIERAGGLNLETVIPLVQFYNMIDRQSEAAKWMRRALAVADDQDTKAGCLLRLGQISEQMHDYESALSYYRQTVALDAGDLMCRYLAHNNLGYCLNLFGRHVEAEVCCRQAIAIYPLRHNAYKNLGIALEQQGDYGSAADLYAQAVTRNPVDGRALNT